MAAQKKYKSAAIQIFNIAVTAGDIVEKINYRELFFNLLPCKKITFSLQNRGDLLQKIQKIFTDKGYVLYRNVPNCSSTHMMCVNSLFTS